MFNEILNPTIDIFDGETNQYLGKGRFELSQQSAKDLLDLVNYGRKPTRLVTYNMDFFQPAEDYPGVTPYERHKRKGILTALFRDTTTGLELPYEITFTYDTLVRSAPYADRYYSGSSEYSNIVIENVRPII